MDAPVQTRYHSTAEERELIYQRIIEIAKEERPVGCRRIFYVLESQGVPGLSEGAKITKDDATAQRITGYCSKLRLGECLRLDNPEQSWELPWDWISDTTREVRKPYVFADLEERLEDARYYRRSVWDNQPVRVQVWIEKDGMIGVFSPVCDEWQVPLLAVRGHCLGFLHECLKDIEATGKKTFVFYFGDSDGHGEEISDNIQAKIDRFKITNVVFERLAITPAQKKLLPTRVGKKTDEAVELDAMNPVDLRKITTKAIKAHFKKSLRAEMDALQERESEWLKEFIDGGLQTLSTL